MLRQELDRRCAELKARMLAAANPDSVVPAEQGHPARQKPKPKAIRKAEPSPAHAEPTPVEPITNPHPLVVRTRKGVAKEKAGEDRLLRLASAERLDLRVSKQAFPRALWIFDALLKAAEACGIRTAIVQRELVWRTVMVAHGEPIAVCIREGLRSVERPRSPHDPHWYRQRYDYFPTGRLTFEVDNHCASRRSWNDGSRQRLENCVDSITESLLVTGERLRDERLRREAEEQIRKVESRYHAENERRARDERERIEALNRDVDNWHQSERIRAYLAAFRSCMEKWSGPIQPKNDVGRWLAWAETYADRLDPLKPQRR
jgi:hypothetical protein